MRGKFLITALSLAALAVGTHEVRLVVEQRRCSNPAPIAQLDDELNQAFIGSEVAKLDCLLDDSFTGFGLNGAVFKKEKMLNDFRTAATRPETPLTQLIQIDERNICVYGDVAIVTASATKSYPQTGVTIRYRYTHVFIKKQIGWVLTVEHATGIAPG